MKSLCVRVSEIVIWTIRSQVSLWGLWVLNEKGNIRVYRTSCRARCLWAPIRNRWTSSPSTIWLQLTFKIDVGQSWSRRYAKLVLPILISYLTQLHLVCINQNTISSVHFIKHRICALSNMDFPLDMAVRTNCMLDHITPIVLQAWIAGNNVVYLEHWENFRGTSFPIDYASLGSPSLTAQLSTISSFSQCSDLNDIQCKFFLLHPLDIPGGQVTTGGSGKTLFMFAFGTICAGSTGFVPSGAYGICRFILWLQWRWIILCKSLHRVCGPEYSNIPFPVFMQWLLQP